MWLKIIVIFTGIFTNLTAPGKEVTLDELINYAELDHNIILDGFRAGNHDASGINDYYFHIQMYALAILKEERKKAFEERLQISRDMGSFGDLQLKTLSYWGGDAAPVQSRIYGEDVRDLMSEAMRSFKISENHVAILVKVFLYEKNKQFIFFGKDQLIGQSSYYIVPESIPHKPKLENKSIEISDELGTMVILKIKYDALDPRRKKKKK